LSWNHESKGKGKRGFV